MGRPRASRDPQGDPAHHAYPGGRPVADIIDTERKVLFWYVGFGQTAGVVVVHSDGSGSAVRGYPGGENKVNKPPKSIA